MRFLGISLIVVGLALICGAFIFWPRVPEPKAAWDLRNEWESKNPAPQSRRSFRKWSGRAEKYDDQIGIDTKQDAAVMAQSEYQSAQDKLARLAALNSDELVARSSASLIFEGGILEETRHHLQMEGQLVAFSVGHGWSLVQRMRCVRGGHQMADTTIHGDDAKLAELAQKMSELVAEEKALSDDAPDRGDELFQQQHFYTAMLKLRPTSLEGYSALARVIVEHCCWPNPVEPGPEIGEEQGLALIITSLAGVSFESVMRDYWPHTRSGTPVTVKGERPV
jgi:hypothetical protein